MEQARTKNSILSWELVSIAKKELIFWNLVSFSSLQHSKHSKLAKQKHYPPENVITFFQMLRSLSGQLRIVLILVMIRSCR